MFNVQDLLKPLIPHAIGVRDICVRSTSLIIERLDEIVDAVSSPGFVEDRKVIYYSLAPGDTANITIPQGETWEIECATLLNTGTGATSGRFRLHEGSVDGLLVWGAFTSADVPLVTSGQNVRLFSGQSLVLLYEWGTTQASARLQFVVRRQKAKVKGRFSGTFERMIDYEYSYAQEGMAERHFATSGQAFGMDNHNANP